MHLQRPDGGDDHRAVGREPRLAALDVEELLGPQVGAEAGLGHHVVGELERGPGGDHRVAAVGDVGEGAAVDQRRVVLQRLHQVGGERVLEQRGHGAVGVDGAGAHRRALPRLADHDIGEPRPQVVEIAREAEDRHHLRRHRDVEAVLARKAVGDAAERGDHGAERAVVHVHDAAPADAARVDAGRVAPVDVVVHHGRQQVVGGADGVEVAGEVEVDVLHRHHLGVAAAGGAALDAEAGAEARLAQRHDGLLADQVEAVAEADGGGGLALARRRRRDRRNQDQLAVRAPLQRADVVEGDLGLVVAVGDQVLGRDAEAVLGEFEDRALRGGARDIDVALGIAVLRACGSGHGRLPSSSAQAANPAAMALPDEGVRRLLVSAAWPRRAGR